MNFIVDGKLFERYPTTHIGVALLEEIDNSKPSDCAQFLADCCARTFEGLRDLDIATHPAVLPWREAYAKFGAKPNKFRSSIEALLRRVQKGAPLPSISPLVDLYNALSVKYCLPCGAEDADCLDGELRLTFAQGTERGTCLGEIEPSTCEVGEVAYLDDTGFVCRRWNWREADRTKITAHTKRAIFVSESLDPNGAMVLEKLIREFLDRAAGVLGGRYRSAVLNVQSPTFTF